MTQSSIRLVYKYVILALIGGFSYVGIELMYRGYSHWSMGILGGICFVVIGMINEFFTWDMPMWKQCLIGSIIVTILEFITGCIVNIWLNWNVWDYSHLPFNILGQICLPFSVIWFCVSAIAIIADDYLRYWLFKEEKPRYKLF